MNTNPVNRILWNRRPTDDDNGDIDELVLNDARLVHIEQMDNRTWWIGITLPDGKYWAGTFAANSRGIMQFIEQENEGVEWDDDQEHQP